MANNISGISGSTNPYATSTYTAESNDKNTMTIESYFKLLAAQLANQDMTNPMDNSELMAQMSNMAMVQSLATLNTNLNLQMAMSKTSYLASLMGKEVSVSVSDDDMKSLREGDNGVRFGTIESVNLSGDEPTFRLKGDPTDYLLTKLLSIGSDVTETTKKAPDGSSSSEEIGPGVQG